MEWLSKLAPTIFNALTGNIPAAAISAAGFIADEFGWVNKAPASVVQQINQLTPDERLKFGQLELQFAQNQAAIFQSQIADTQNARSREVSMNQAGKRDWTTPIMAYVITSVFVAASAYVFKFPIPKENANIVWFLLGQISGFMAAVVTYYFGSSRGSADKNDTINSLSKL